LYDDQEPVSGDQDYYQEEDDKVGGFEVEEDDEFAENDRY
jgi:hypothetical protein